MSLAQLRQMYLDNNPGITLPPMASSIAELKQYFDDWLEQNKHFHPKVVPADGDPPLCYSGFRAFYIDESGVEHSVIKAVPMEQMIDRIYFDKDKKMRDRFMDLRDHYDKLTTYHEKYRKEYIPVEDDGTVKLPPGRQI